MGTIVARGTSSVRPNPPPEDPRGPHPAPVTTSKDGVPENDVLAEMQRLSRLTPDDVDPQKAALVRTLWRRCITQQSVPESGPAKELLAAGVAEEALLKAMQKAALESLIAALVTFDEFEITEQLSSWVYLGDPTATDGASFNY
jgi:hypothetical protein